jgi:hypothetical protein
MSELVERYAGNATWLAKQRQRLSSPSWLLRLVKQEVARRANAEDDVAGHFWESRFTSVVLVDGAAVLACLVYVDLNPLRAGLVRLPEASDFTSIRHRFHRARHDGGSARADPDAADVDLGRRLVGMRACAPVNTVRQSRNQEVHYRHCRTVQLLLQGFAPHPTHSSPISPDEPEISTRSATWTGEPESWGIDEAAYVDLVEETGRTLAVGKRGSIPAQAPPLIERLGISEPRWHQAMADSGRMLGSVIGGPESRQAWAEQAGQRWAADKSGLWG